MKNPSGSICPAGSFCPEGTSAVVNCPAKTYTDAEGGDSVGDCYPCPPGKQCPTAGMTTWHVTDCAIGYYCPESQDSDTPVAYKCEKGYYCAAGSRVQQLCLPGFY